MSIIQQLTSLRSLRTLIIYFVSAFLQVWGGEAYATRSTQHIATDTLLYDSCTIFFKAGYGIASTLISRRIWGRMGWRRN